MFFKTLSKRTILGCCLLASVFNLNAQNIEREAVTSGLTTITNGTITMNSSIGEIATTTIGPGNPTFRQGVLQTTTLKYIYSAGSWSPENPVGAATANDVVIVQDGSTTLIGDLTALSIDVDAGASLDLSSHTVNLHGDLTNNGVLSGSDATLNHRGFEGTVSGNPFTVSTLINNATSNLVLNTDVSITDLVSVNSGNVVNQSGKLIFKSGATKTAMLDQISGSSSIVGDVQVERYYQATRAFRFISSPVTTSTSINQNWQEGVNNTSLEYSANQNPNPGFGTHITGSSTGSNGFDMTDTGNPSLFGFDNINQSWNAVPNTTSVTLNAGTPYRLFIRGDRSMNINIDGDPSTETRIRAQGALKIGAHSDPNLNTTAGSFNFVGNPYQASINMNNVLAASSNLNTNNFYVWDPNLQSGIGAYVTVDLPAGTNTSGSQANQYLQPSQGAFVRTLANGAASINFEETHKSVGENTNVYGVSNQSNSIIGQIYKTNAGVSGTYPEDSFGIDFNATFSNSIDQYDAVKPFNIRENIYINTQDNNLSLEKRDFPLENEQINIDHLGYSASEYLYKLNVVGLLNYEVYLKDDYLNNLTLLESGINDISFTVNTSDASAAIDRFSLVFQNQTLSSGDLNNNVSSSIYLYPNPVVEDDLMVVFKNTGSQWNALNHTYRVTTLLGQLVMSDALSINNGESRISGFRNVATGAYIVDIYSGDEKVFTAKILKN